MKDQFNTLVEYLLGSGLFLEQAVEILEKTLIERAMEKTHGNRSAASKLLGIHRNTLQRKMRLYNLEPRRMRRKPVRSTNGTRPKVKAG